MRSGGHESLSAPDLHLISEKRILYTVELLFDTVELLMSDNVLQKCLVRKRVEIKL